MYRTVRGKTVVKEESFGCETPVKAGRGFSSDNVVTTQEFVLVLTVDGGLSTVL